MFQVHMVNLPNKKNAARRRPLDSIRTKQLCWGISKKEGLALGCGRRVSLLPRGAPGAAKLTRRFSFFVSAHPQRLWLCLLLYKRHPTLLSDYVPRPSPRRQ
jgi:hypothetical protein